MAKEKTKPQRIQRVVLIGSLALNLLIIGVATGVAISGGRPGAGQRFDLTVSPLTRAMEGARKDAVRDVLRNSGVFEHDHRSGMQRDMNALLATLKVDEFDEVAFRAVLMRQRDRFRSGQETVLGAVSAQIDDMSTSERAAFADRLEEQMRRGHRARQ
ncbi:MAG: putative membrane protein [Alteromonas macleodii]|jgi:uncharacterized membrane protein